MTYDWIKIKTYYMTHRMITSEELANIFNGDVKYFQNKVGEEKWREEREEIWNSAGRKMVERMPDRIADVKIRHAQIGRIMQSKVIETIKNGKIISKSTYSDLKTAIDIERDALGLNDKKTNEESQALQQYNFIINLKPDELRRFVKSVERRRATQSGSDSPDAATETSEDGGDSDVDTATVSG